MEWILSGSFWHHQIYGFKDITLLYFKVYKPATFQVNNSKKGLGTTYGRFFWFPDIM